MAMVLKEYSGERSRPSWPSCFLNSSSEKYFSTLSFLWNLTYPRLMAFLNPFPNKPWFLRVCSISLLKTPWEKEKLLVTSNFSFSHSVFYPFKKILPFSSNLKLSSANYLSLGQSKICRLGKG